LQTLLFLDRIPLGVKTMSFFIWFFSVFVFFKGNFTMSKSLYSALAAAVVLMLSSCATPIPMGFIYNGGTTLGAVANNNVKPIKMGKSCVISVLQLVSAGDGGIDAAKREGNITKVASVDYDFMSVLGVYGQYCTIVRGE
jgi:hypothetical protein